MVATYIGVKERDQEVWSRLARRQGQPGEVFQEWLRCQCGEGVHSQIMNQVQVQGVPGVRVGRTC